MPKRTVKVSDAKVVDPSFGFTLATEDKTPFNCKLSVLVSINGFEYDYSSEVSINNPVVANQVDFLVPFGDTNWHDEKYFDVTLTVTYDPPGDFNNPDIIRVENLPKPDSSPQQNQGFLTSIFAFLKGKSGA